jgi:hypothetical protein
VRHAELQLAREKALLDEQERRITHELNAAFVELDRAFLVARTTYNRSVATERQLKTVREKWRLGAERLDFVLDAERRVVEAEIEHYRAIVDYNIALTNLNYARGMLLDSMRVSLAEGPWPRAAYQSATKQSRRFRKPLCNRCYTIPEPVSRGAYPQRIGSMAPPPSAETAPPDGSAECPNLQHSDQPPPAQEDWENLPAPLPENWGNLPPP